MQGWVEGKLEEVLKGVGVQGEGVFLANPEDFLGKIGEH